MNTTHNEALELREERNRINYRLAMGDYPAYCGAHENLLKRLDVINRRLKELRT